MKQIIHQIYLKRLLALLVVLALPAAGLSVGNATARRESKSGPAVGASAGVVTPQPSFNDVPTSNPFFTEISNIAYRQITVGCGGGNFCPNDIVTRAQMAAFI